MPAAAECAIPSLNLSDAFMLIVKAYPDLHYPHTVPPERNVYLVRVDGAARSGTIWDCDIALPLVRQLVAWADSHAIPVECQPPGCLSEEFVWPAEGYGGIVLHPRPKPLPPQVKMPTNAPTPEPAYFWLD